MRIAIVGLGSIAAHHIAALEELSDAEVVAGVDPAVDRIVRFRGAPIALYPTVPDLDAAGPVDIAIVTAPTPVHASIVDEIARDRSCRILVEKPLAANMADVRRLLADSFPNDVRTLFHAAAAPEVDWALGALDELVARHGAVVSVDMWVADGSVAPLDTLRRSLGNAWIDLGINALSIASRFVSLEHVELSLADREHETYKARVSFRHGNTRATGSMLVTWGGPEPAKFSEFRFDDGTQLILDHQNGTARVTTNRNRNMLFEVDRTRSRLQWHYFNLFAAVLDGGRLVDRATELAVHELLFGA